MALDKIQELSKAIIELDSAISSFLESNPDPADACQVLAELNFLKRDLSIVYDGCAGQVGHIMGTLENIVLGDGTVIEKKSAYDRKGWLHAELGHAVANKLAQMAVDMDTGEIIKQPHEIAADMLSYCAPSYWRIKELNKLGINADNYSSVGELKTSIIVRKAKTNL